MGRSGVYVALLYSSQLPPIITGPNTVQATPSFLRNASSVPQRPALWQPPLPPLDAAQPPGEYRPIYYKLERKLESFILLFALNYHVIAALLAPRSLAPTQVSSVHRHTEPESAACTGPEIPVQIAELDASSLPLRCLSKSIIHQAAAASSGTLTRLLLLA